MNYLGVYFSSQLNFSATGSKLGGIPIQRRKRDTANPLLCFMRLVTINFEYPQK